MHATALRLSYQGYSARSIYMTFWPAGTDAPARLDTFTRALQDLLAETEEDCRRAALSRGVPFVAPSDVLTEDQWAQLAEAPRVVEDPLDPATVEALADLDGARQLVCDELRRASEDPLDADAGETRTKRGATVAALGNALTAVVTARLRATQLRVQRTVLLHNLRLAREEEARETQREERAPAQADGARTARVPEAAPAAPAFQLRLPGGD